MNYPKLEIFDVVELRDGRLAVVLLISEDFDETVLGLYSRNYVFTPRIIIKDSYTDDLTYNDSSDLDIMKVLKYNHVKTNNRFSHEAYMRMITDIVIRRGLLDLENFKTFNINERLKPYGWTWVREECKEVTMAEVEEKFGCKVKIVKE